MQLGVACWEKISARHCSPKSSVPEILVYRHHHVEKAVNNIDIRIVHGYVYVIKASTNGRARDMLIKRYRDVI